jgi:hypothetical protein
MEEPGPESPGETVVLDRVHRILRGLHSPARFSEASWLWAASFAVASLAAAYYFWRLL